MQEGVKEDLVDGAKEELQKAQDGIKVEQKNTQDQLIEDQEDPLEALKKEQDSIAEIKAEEQAATSLYVTSLSKEEENRLLKVETSTYLMRLNSRPGEERHQLVFATLSGTLLVRTHSRGVVYT